jgi:hypothetical protein
MSAVRLYFVVLGGVLALLAAIVGGALLCTWAQINLGIIAALGAFLIVSMLIAAVLLAVTMRFGSLR